MKKYFLKRISVLLAVLMLLTAFPISSAYEVESPDNVTYLDASFATTDLEDWYAWTWNDNSGRWVRGTEISNSVYSFYHLDYNVVFVRADKTKTIGWDNGSVYNQTEDLVNHTGDYFFIITAWETDKSDKMRGKWEYVGPNIPPTDPTVTVEPRPTNPTSESSTGYTEPTATTEDPTGHCTERDLPYAPEFKAALAYYSCNLVGSSLSLIDIDIFYVDRYMVIFGFSDNLCTVGEEDIDGYHFENWNFFPHKDNKTGYCVYQNGIVYGIADAVKNNIMSARALASIIPHSSKTDSTAFTSTTPPNPAKPTEPVTKSTAAPTGGTEPLKTTGTYNSEQVSVGTKPTETSGTISATGLLAESTQPATEPSPGKSAPTQPAAISISKAKFSAVSDRIYTGKAVTPTIRVKYKDKILLKNIDYTLSFRKNKNAGTASIVITGKGDYTGTKTINFRILKAANTMIVKAAAKTVKITKLNEVNQTVSAIISTKPIGKLTYIKFSGPKFLTVALNGRITVKKGTKRGIYTIKVKVAATGNSNYKPATKTATVKISVK